MIINKIKITHRFKFYDNIVVDDQKQLWQLQHFSLASKRTRRQRLLTYNKQRDAYRINNVWVTKAKLYKLCYPVNENLNTRQSKNL